VEPTSEKSTDQKLSKDIDKENDIDALNDIDRLDIEQIIKVTKEKKSNA
jgi:hypothetical protein